MGSRLCEEEISAGHQVICMDNFSSGSMRNIEHLLDSPQFTLIEHDIISPLFIEAEEIFNLACPASPIRYQADPTRTSKTNVLGAINMLDTAMHLRIPILQASTSEVYGDPDVHPQTEQYWGRVNPIGVRSCYDEGKRCAETLFFDYHRQYQVRIKIARIFNTYGPRMLPDDGRVVSNFIVQALKGEPITIYGDGQQTRSFCYVDDLVCGLQSLMNTPDAITGPCNLGSSDEICMIELAEHIVELVGSTSRFVFLPLPEDDPRQRQPDLTYAGDILDWRPSVRLREGLIKTVAYFETYLSTCT